MAAKATILDITDAGFRQAQFGTPDDRENDSWAEPDGYLDRLLARASAWAIGRFGARYVDVVVPMPEFEQLRSAELCWVSAQLWKRRAGFVDSNAVASRDDMNYLNRREYEAQADRAMECAEAHMCLALGDRTQGSAVAMTHVVSGPFLTARGLSCGQ